MKAGFTQNELTNKLQEANGNHHTNLGGSFLQG